MKINLKNKTALITGATSGIGACIASILIKKYDCTVYAVGRNETKANLVKKSLGEEFENKYIPIFADVSTVEGIQKVIQVGSFDFLFNNAGIMPPFEKVENANVLTTEKVFATNFFAPVKLIDLALKNSLINKGGAIINISSSDALCPIAGTSAYSASKSALASFSEVLSQETDILVCTVYPGFTQTDLFSDVSFSDGLIKKISASAYKTASKIVSALKRGSRRVIVGSDAKWMNFLYKIAPVKGPLLIKKILKKSGRDTFKNI